MFGAMVGTIFKLRSGNLDPSLRTLFNSRKQRVNDENTPEVYPVYTFRSL